MSDDYTPTTEEVREAYQSSEEGLDFKRIYHRRGEEFDRWLAKVKADTWDEGHLIHGEDYRHPRQCRDSSGCIAQNPYRIEGKTDD